MQRKNRFRVLLPLIQCPLAALFGGIGLWQRSAILSRPGFFEGTTMWDTTARFHVWPWAYKFAVVSNIPALLAGLLLTVAIGAVRPTMPEAAQLAPTLVFVMIVWFWIGSRLDRRWVVTEKTPWIILLVSNLVCLVGALIPMEYTGFLPHGFLAWLVIVIPLRHVAKTAPQ
jgi:hypothetical protein